MRVEDLCVGLSAQYVFSSRRWFRPTTKRQMRQTCNVIVGSPGSIFKLEGSLLGFDAFVAMLCLCCRCIRSGLIELSEPTCFLFFLDLSDFEPSTPLLVWKLNRVWNLAHLLLYATNPRRLYCRSGAFARTYSILWISFHLWTVGHNQ